MEKKKQVGIWLDVRNAYLIDVSLGNENTEEQIVHIHSDIEETEGGGGTRSKSPWGPQGGDSQRRLQERIHHEEKAYFEKIIHAIDPKTDELLLFGPSTAKLGLRSAIKEIKHYHPVIAAVEAADQMTVHQMEAWAKAFFHHPDKRRLPRV